MIVGGGVCAKHTQDGLWAENEVCFQTHKATAQLTAGHGGKVSVKRLAI